ncbi:MAG: sugar phosphate isomerase/epimerase [Deltaproteobacteria bacterium]|jgi:hypothetical protein|nr:sugar phosphate isomerase/epimerase [Deltaproteobacteria bacterium]
MIFLTMTYATLFLRAIDPAGESFNLLKRLGLLPEINFESGWTAFSYKRHRELAQIVLDHFPGAAVHLPYGGLDFGRGEGFAVKKDKILKAVETANLYRPHHFIAHPSFKSLTDSVLGPKKYPGFKRDNLSSLSQSPGQSWLERSVSVWSAVLGSSQASLCLENTHEHSPEPILALLDRLEDRAGFCLDFGHWFHYAMGRHWDNLDFWLDKAASKLRHAHVHDNNGEGDQHRALGQGLIDYDKVRELLAERDLRPNVTIENHLAQDLLESYNVLAQTPLWTEPLNGLKLKVS